MIYDHQRNKAQPGLRSLCPLCESGILAKCGDLTAWHWAHISTIDCDPWYESMSAWHRDWQNLVPAAQREVIMPPHRADMIIPLPAPPGVLNPFIVELQHSSIAADEVAAREQFYGQMAWVFDATDAYAEDRLYLTRQLWNDNVYGFRWKHGRKSIIYCRKPIILDLGEKLLNIRRLDVDGRMGGYGYVLPRALSSIVAAKPRKVRTS